MFYVLDPDAETLTEYAKERVNLEISRYKNAAVFSAHLPEIAASGSHR